MRTKLIILACLACLISSVLSAQTVGEWLAHPSLSAASQVVERYDASTRKFSTMPLVMLRARFGEDTKPFYATVLFDLPTTRFLTAEAVWQPIPQVGLRVGLQKMLFLFETMFAPYTYGVIGYSQAASILGGYTNDLTGISSRSRDVGIVLRGSFWPTGEGYSKLSYAIGVFNGNGYSFVDNNRAKDIQFRLVYQPISRLKISLGAMNGYYNVDHEDAPGHHHYHTSENLACRRRLSLGVWYEDDKLFVRSEDLFGITDGMKSNGIMALVGYKPWPRIQFSARGDHFQRDMSDPLSRSTKLDIAFTHFLLGDGTIYYALQYGHTFYSDPNIRGVDTIQLCVNIAFLRKL